MQTQHEFQERIQYLQNHYGIDSGRSGEDVVGEGNKFRNDWWTTSLGSDHSLDEATQASIVQGPDYSQAIMENNGVFTTVSRGNTDFIQEGVRVGKTYETVNEKNEEMRQE